MDHRRRLIHEGWNHLKSQRPLAAWGSWQRALRADPDSRGGPSGPRGPRIRVRLAPGGPDRLTDSARPVDPARRAAWDDRMRGQSDQDLDATADLFGRLATADPTDSAAWYNRALCLAWMGKNLEAIGCLDRVVGLEAERAFDLAVDAWTLAEVLRQGGGAETLADDLRFACTMAWKPGNTSWLLEEFPEIQRVPTPRAPGHRRKTLPRSRCSSGSIGRSRASLNHAASHRPAAAWSWRAFISAAKRFGCRVPGPRTSNGSRRPSSRGSRRRPARSGVKRRRCRLPFLDADVWIFRVPPGLDPDLADQLSREAVEHYFENQWIHRPRHGLDGRSPLAAGLEASRGDAVARAKLTAVVRLREQLGNRPSALLLYQGYPFDRLRRRLGLELVYPNAVDLQDLGCASGEELDRLDPATLDDSRLVEAFTSAAGLRDDARTARLASELLKRRPAAMASLDLTAVVSPLVRLAMGRNDYKAALSWLKEARSMSGGDTATTLEIWRAEVFARAGRPDSAMVVYERLITPDAAGARSGPRRRRDDARQRVSRPRQSSLAHGGRHGSKHTPNLDRKTLAAVA